MGIHPLKAGIIVSSYWLCMFIGRAIGGYYGARFSSHDMLSFAAFGALALIVMAIFTPSKIMFVFGRYGTDIPVNVLFLILCGLFTSVMWGSDIQSGSRRSGQIYGRGIRILHADGLRRRCHPYPAGALPTSSVFLNSLWLIFACLAFILYYASAGYRMSTRRYRSDMDRTSLSCPDCTGTIFTVIACRP